MRKTDTFIKKIFSMRLLCLLLPVLVITALEGCVNREELKAQEVQAFRDSGCDGVFIAMYGTDGYRDGMFASFLGIPTYICNTYHPENEEELISFVNEICGQNPSGVKYVLLGVDPGKLEFQAENEESFKKVFEDLSDVNVDIILPVYPYDYWKSMKEEKYNTVVENYQKFANMLVDYENVYMYFEGDKLWLLANPNCYMEDTEYALKPAAANDAVLIDTVFSHTNLVNAENMSSKIYSLESRMEYIEENNLFVPKKKNKNDVCVFLGDSVFGNYEDPTSIPSVVESYTGMECYNCGIGGLTIVDDNERKGLKALLSAVTDPSGEGESACNDFLENNVKPLNKEDFQTGRQVCLENKKNITFFVELGLNDYFGGMNTDVTKEKLKEGLQTIEGRFPDSRIVLVSPGYIATPNFGGGEMPVYEGGGTLEEYRELVQSVGAELGLDVIDLKGLGFIGEENCADFLDYTGIHYNEIGRYNIGLEIVHYLEALNGTL